MSNKEQRHLEYLNAILDLSSRADQAVVFLQSGIQNAHMPDFMREALQEVVTTIRLQTVLIRRMSVEQMDVQDRLDQLLMKLNASLNQHK